MCFFNSGKKNYGITVLTDEKGIVQVHTNKYTALYVVDKVVN